MSMGAIGSAVAGAVVTSMLNDSPTPQVQSSDGTRDEVTNSTQNTAQTTQGTQNTVQNTSQNTALDLSGVTTGQQQGQSQSTVDADLRPYLQQLYAQAMQAGPYQIAGISPYATTGLGNINTGANQQIAAAGTLNPMINNAQNSLGFLMSQNMLDPNSNPYLAAAGQAAINPIYQRLTEEILPAISSGAVATGNIGSSRQGIAEGRAIEGTQRVAADTLAQMYSNAYQNGLGTMLQAQSLAPSTIGLSTLPGQIVGQAGQAQLGAGQAEQALNQGQLNADYQTLALLRSIFQPTGAMSTTTSGTTQGTTSQTQQGQTRGQTTTNTTTQQELLQEIIENMTSNVVQTGNVESQMPGMNPLQAALGGGALGYGVYNSLFPPQQTTNPYFAPTGDYDPNLGFDSGD